MSQFYIDNNLSGLATIDTITGNSGGALGPDGSNNFNFSGGTTGLVFTGSGSTETITGILVAGNGGTGVTSVTTSPTASSFAGWDAQRNLSADNFLSGYATTVTAVGTTTLTVDSVYQQYFTGVTTQTVVLPVTSTLVLGQSYRIVNNSSGPVTINSSGGNLVVLVDAASESEVTCILTSGTTAASWSTIEWVSSPNGIISIAGSSGSATGTTVTISPGSTGLTYAAAANSVTTAGVLVVSNGGTGLSTATTAYGTLTAGVTAAGAFQNAGTGTSGQIFKSNGSAALPTWVAPSSVGGSLVLIQSQTAAAAATLSFTTGITGYTTYMFVFNDLHVTSDNTDLKMLFSADGGATYQSSGYVSGINYAPITSTIMTNKSSGTYFYISSGQSSLDLGVCGNIFITNIGTANTTISGQVTWAQSGTDMAFCSICGRSNVASINAFRFQSSSGNITGQVSLYGIATS